MVEAQEGTVVEGRVEFGEGMLEAEMGEADIEEEAARQWQEWVEHEWEEKQIGALRGALKNAGEEGMTKGKEHALLGSLMECIEPELRRMLEEAEERLQQGLPSGPEFPEPPGCNLQRFRDKKQEFVSGAVHLEDYRKAWRELVPKPHSEVLRWVESMFPEGH